MAGEHCLLAPQRVQQTNRVAGQIDEVVVCDLLRFVSCAESSLVGCHGAKTSLRQRWKLMAPSNRKIRKTVKQNHGESGALLVHGKCYARITMAGRKLDVRGLRKGVHGNSWNLSWALRAAVQLYTLRANLTAMRCAAHELR